MSSPGKPEVTPTAPPAPQPSMRRPPPGATALPGMVAPGGPGTDTINVVSSATEAEIKATKEVAAVAVATEMAGSTVNPTAEAPVPKPRTTVRGPPAGAMALPGMAAPSGPSGVEATHASEPVNDEKRPPMETVGAAATEVAAAAATTAAVVEQANVASLPVNDEKRPPIETVDAAATEVVAVAATTAAVIEHAASQMAPELVNPPTGTAAGSQQPYEAPPSYSETIQQGGYPHLQPGYNPQPGFQQYPPQQGYPPQAAYPQAGGPQPGYAAGGYQAPPVPQQEVPGKPGMVPENVGYGAPASAAYPAISQPQPTETTPVIAMSSSEQPSSRQLPVKTKEWDKGLCSCCSNCGLCLLSWLCPCYMVGKNAEALGHSCCLYGVGSIIPLIRCVAQIILRTEIRNHRGIKGSEFGDFCYVCFCTVCALTQEANEVQVMAKQEIQRE